MNSHDGYVSQPGGVSCKKTHVAERGASEVGNMLPVLERRTCIGHIQVYLGPVNNSNGGAVRWNGPVQLMCPCIDIQQELA